MTQPVPYLPKKDKDSLVFYGTQKFYVFLRFVYTLYERVLKAYELCHEFEDNAKTRGLSIEEKSSLGEERYQAFKLILIYLLRPGSTSEIYEDLLRCIFGNNAFYMFTIQKILTSVSLTTTMVTDPTQTSKSI